MRDLRLQIVVPGAPLSGMEQQWSRHSHLTPLKARACGDKKRRPIFAVVRMVHIADRLYAATTALSDPPGSPTAATTCQVHH